MWSDDTKVLSVRLPEDLAGEMAYVCRVDEVSISEGMRAAVYRYIEVRRADKRFQARLKARVEKDREVLERLGAVNPAENDCNGPWIGGSRRRPVRPPGARPTERAPGPVPISRPSCRWRTPGSSA